MAQYRLSAKIMSRSSGPKIVAAAAYRSGEKLDDRHYGETHDYERRGGVVHAEIVLPGNAPEWAGDRAELWSRVEDNEKRENAQLAREVQLSLPHEMNEAQRVELALEFAQHIADEYGFAVDTAIHAPGREGDDRNHHAHLLMTTRGFDEDRESGWSKIKDRRFDDIAMKRAGEPNAVEAMREVWEGMQNRALERADIRGERGELVQVDRRSHDERGIDQEPTIKLGPAASGMQRRGEDSDRVATNDEIMQRNAARRAEREQIEREAGAVKLEMAGLFEAIANRPADALRFRRRQRELEALHTEVSELVKGPRQSDRMNDLLLGGPDDRHRKPIERPELLDTYPELDELTRKQPAPPTFQPGGRSR